MPIHKINPNEEYNNYDGILNVNRHGDTARLAAHEQSPFIDHTAEISGTYSIRFDDYGLRRKTYEIGPWDMTSKGHTAVSHGLGEEKWKDVCSTELILKNDADDKLYSGGNSVGVSGLNDVSVSGIDSSRAILTRRDGGFFDSSSFNSTFVSRGKLTLWYT